MMTTTRTTHYHGPGARRHLVRWLGAIVVAVVAVAAIAPAASADTTVAVNWTRIGIYPRQSPSMDSAKIGAALSDGAHVTLSCEQESQPVSNGYQTIAIWDQLTDGTWLPNAFLDTGSASWTPGVPRCSSDETSSTGEQAQPMTPAQPATSHIDPCSEAYPDAEQRSTDQFGGHQTNANRQMSLYQVVCGNFGAPADLNFSPAMKCALIAASATYGGPEISIPTNRACRAADIIDAYQSNDWLGYATGEACGYFSDVFATGVGIFAAGATAETGPGAVAIGVNTYRALAASLHVVCGGLFDGGAVAVGEKLEADHETDIATDVLKHGKCIREDVRFGLVNWSAATC